MRMLPTMAVTMPISDDHSLSFSEALPSRARSCKGPGIRDVFGVRKSVSYVAGKDFLCGTGSCSE